jgi:hypothetical protein
MTTRRVSAEDLVGALESLIRAAGSVGIVPPADHSWTFQKGSKSSGRAFRVMFVDNTSGGLAHCPLFSQGFVGMTPAEAYRTITTVAYALDGVRYEQDKVTERDTTPSAV